MNKRLYFIILTLIVACCFALGDISSLLAQETSTEEFTLEEITVTAQKREENQQKVAIAMDVISAEEIKELGKNSIDEILSGVSSAIIQKAADGYRVSIRGMSDDAAASFGQSQSTPSVALNTDGVYSNRKDTGGGLYDVERVEVLYGPQSTMYSSNSPGGIVNVITASPKLDKYEVSTSVEAGNYNLLHTEGAVNVPVGNITALRASISTSKRDGYMTGDGDNENTKSARLRALFQPNDKLSVTLTGEYSKNKGAGFGSGVQGFDTEDGYYADGTKVTNPWTAREDETLASNDQTSKKVFMNMNLDMGSIGSLTFVPSYATRKGNNAMNMMDELVYNDQLVREKSAELRMTSAADFFFKWIVGATYYNSSDTNNQVSSEYLLTGSGDYSFRTNEEKAKAVYANVTYPIKDTFRVTGGIRKSWDDMVTENEEVKRGESQPGSGTQSSPSRPDIKVGFEYDLGTNSMLYGDYSTSYRVQAMSAASDPQEVKAFSLGAKNRFFGNKLQLNASTYYYDYKNYGVNWRENVWIEDLDGDFLPPEGMAPPGSTSEYEEDDGARDKIGQGRMMGLDLSASAIITSKDMVNLSLSYIKSEWTDLKFTWEYTEELSTVYDANGNAIGTEWVAHPDDDYTGKPMTNTPPWTINLNYTHNFNLWNGGVLRASINAKYQTEYNLSWEDDYYPYNFQESHHMLGANASYSDPSGKWSLSASVNNIFNYAEKLSYMNFGGQGVLFVGNPRTYSGVLSVKF